MNGTYLRFAQRAEHHDSKQPVLIAFTEDDMERIAAAYTQPDEEGKSVCIRVVSGIHSYHHGHISIMYRTLCNAIVLSLNTQKSSILKVYYVHFRGQLHLMILILGQKMKLILIPSHN